MIRLKNTHYLFAFIILLSTTTCLFSTNKPISIPFDDPSTCDITVEVNMDDKVCGPGDYDLAGNINGDYDSFVWCENGSETGYDLDETVDLSETTTFTLKAFNQNEESIIINGDFESGDSDFTTDYTPGQGNCSHPAGFLGCEGFYNILDDPSLGHNNFDPCDDNGGGGSMMVVNGAAALQEIWCQEVCVEPGATYVFNAYAASVNPGSPAILQFAIDGTLIGDLFNLTGSTCVWEYFEAEWSASAETSVEICVTNQNTAAGGNDFALDDIGFFQVCEDQASFEVVIINFEVWIDQPEDLDCINTTQDINLTIDPPGIYDIVWDTQDGDIVTESFDGSTITVESEGTYTVNVTDVNGCTREEEVTVYSNVEYPILDIDIEGSLNCTENEVEVFIDANLSGIDYVWTNEDGDIVSEDDNFFIYSAGIYSVTATDSDTGCTSEDAITITADPSQPDFDLGLTEPLNCNAVFTFIYTTVPYDSVQWVALNQNLTFPTSNDSLIVSVAGLYEATVLLANGCFHKDTIEVIEADPIFTHDIMIDNLDCNQPQGQISLNIDTSIYSFSWENYPASYSDSLVITYDTAQSFTLMITDSLGCTKELSYESFENFEAPQVNATATEIDCDLGFSNVNIPDPVDAFLVEWYDNSGNTYSGDQIEVYQSGVLYYEVTTPTNGCSTLDSIVITGSNDFPDVSISAGLLNCSNTVDTLITTVNQNIISYTWENSDGTLIPGDSTLIITEGGDYLVTVINELGCESTALITTVFDTVPPALTLPTDVTLNCNALLYNGFITPESDWTSIDYTGDWFDPMNLEFSIDQAGTYELMVTSLNGCTATDIITVAIDTITPELTLLSDTVLNCNILSLDAFANVSTASTTGEWTSNNFMSTENNIEISEPGIYTYTATGENGCTNIASINIIADNEEPQFTVEVIDIGCSNAEGIISVISNEFLASVEYYQGNILLDTGLTFESDILDPITVIATGENGCMSNQTVTIQENLTNASFSVQADPLDCTTNPVFISIVESLDIISSQITDQDGNPIGDITSPILNTGTYDISITLSDGCMGQESITIMEDIVDFDFTPQAEILDCTGNPVFISILENLAIAESEIYDAFGTFVGDLFAPVSEPGLYYVNVTLNDGCNGTASIAIALDESIVDFGLTAEMLTCNTNEIFIQIQAAENYTDTYILDDQGNNLGNINTAINTSGIYTVGVVGDNGCISENIIEVFANNDIPELSYEQKLLDCSETIALDNIVISGGTAPYQISIDGIDQTSINTNISIVGSGTHEVLVTDANGCTLLETIDVEPLTPVDANITPSLTVQINTDNQLNLNLNKPLSEIESIEWIPADGLSCSDCVDPIANVDEEKLYSIFVTDNNGCKTETEIKLQIQRSIRYYVPNVFIIGNNNGSDNNFTLFSRDNDITLIKTMSIFDRWGNKVFINNDFLPNQPELGWDGYFSGGKVEQGVYVFSAVIELANGEEEKVSGGVTVLQ